MPTKIPQMLTENSFDQNLIVLSDDEECLSSCLAISVDYGTSAFKIVQKLSISSVKSSALIKLTNKLDLISKHFIDSN